MPRLVTATFSDDEQHKRVFEYCESAKRILLSDIEKLSFPHPSIYLKELKQNLFGDSKEENFLQTDPFSLLASVLFQAFTSAILDKLDKEFLN